MTTNQNAAKTSRLTVSVNARKTHSVWHLNLNQYFKLPFIYLQEKFRCRQLTWPLKYFLKNKLMLCFSKYTVYFRDQSQQLWCLSNISCVVFFFHLFSLVHQTIDYYILFLYKIVYSYKKEKIERRKSHIRPWVRYFCTIKLSEAIYFLSIPPQNIFAEEIKLNSKFSILFYHTNLIF